jgi:NUMOD4 motif
MQRLWQVLGGRAMIERWKQIVGSNNRYEISSFGRVRRLLNRADEAFCEIVKPVESNGRFYIHLKYHGQSRLWSLAVLVLHHFGTGAKMAKKSMPQHLDGDFHNCCIDNLQWATPVLSGVQEAWGYS